MEANKFIPLFSAWRADRRMRASAWSTGKLSGPDQICRTLARPGDLAPDDASPSWSFHLGLPETLGKPAVIQLANGFVFRFPHLADPPRFACLAIDRGIYLGSTSLELRPTLFSPGQEVETEGEDQWLRLADQTVLLRIRKEDAGTRFALCIARGPDDSSVQAAEAALAAPLDALLRKEYSLRDTFWNSLVELEGELELLVGAAEEVVFHLESASDPFAYRWSAAQVPDRGRVDVNQLYPLVKAWLSLDPSVARELVAGVLTAVRPDGFLPASFAPGRPADGSREAAWPYLARAVTAVADASLTESSIETIRACLSWSTTQLNPSQAGLLCWRSAEEALIPDTFDHQMASPALSAMVLADLEAFETMTDAGLDESLMNAQERIVAQLESFLWNAENEIYRDRYLSGKNTSRDTLAGFMPLSWTGLPVAHRTSLLEKIESPTYFGDPDGVPLWQEWENDPTPPPISAGFQLLLLDAMGGAADQAAQRNLQDRVAGAMVRQVSVYHAFPTHLRPSAQSTNRDAPAVAGIDAPVVGACLALTVLPEVYRRKGGESTSQFWLALDRHRVSIMASLIGVVGLLVIGTALNLARKPSVRGPSETDAAGLVQEFIRQGQLAQALEILDENDTGPDRDKYWLTRANIYCRMGNYADAEKEYRAMLEKDFRRPIASVNLALTLFQQGKFDEAAEVYDRCREEFALSDPEIVERAQEASRFIRLYRDTLVPQK